MIRIHLQPRGGRLLPFLLLALGTFALGLFGFGYLSRDEQSMLPGELALSPAARSEVPAEAEAAAPPPTAEAGDTPAATEDPPAPDPGPPPAPPEEAAPKATKPEAAKAPPAPAVRSNPPVSAAPAAAKAPAVPATGPLCLRILRLHERLPAVVRCTSLSGNAAGEYTIEGAVPSGDFPQLIVLLDELKRASVQANLYGGMAGKKEGDYAFNLHGQFPAGATAATAPVEASQATAFFAQAAALARKTRLDSVRVGAAVFAPTGKGVVHQRQKLWATGTYQQLETFLEALSRQQPQLRIEEVNLVPRYRGESQWKQAQFYAVLSTGVRAAR